MWPTPPLAPVMSTRCPAAGAAFSSAWIAVSAASGTAAACASGMLLGAAASHSSFSTQCDAYVPCSSGAFEMYVEETPKTASPALKRLPSPALTTTPERSPPMMSGNDGDA